MDLAPTVSTIRDTNIGPVGSTFGRNWMEAAGEGDIGGVRQIGEEVLRVCADKGTNGAVLPARGRTEVLRSWREYCNACPDEVSSIALCGTVPSGDPFPPAAQGRAFVAIGAIHSGTPHEGQRILQPLRELSAQLCDFSAVTPYVEI